MNDARLNQPHDVDRWRPGHHARHEPGSGHTYLPRPAVQLGSQTGGAARQQDLGRGGQKQMNSATVLGLVDVCLNRDIHGNTCSIHEGARRTSDCFDQRRVTENGLLIREAARRSAKNVFLIRGRLGKSLFLSRKVDEGLHLSALKRPSPTVNGT